VHLTHEKRCRSLWELAWVAAAVLALRPAVAQAADAYVFWVQAPTVVQGNFLRVLFTTHFFRNTSGSTQPVNLLGVSNGVLATSPGTLTIPASSIRVVAQNIGPPGINWFPQPFPGVGPVWVMRLDLPAGVILSSRIEVGAASLIPGLVDDLVYDTASLPVFSALVPAGLAQTWLGVDKAQRDRPIHAYVYNAGASVATATINIVQDCTNATLASMSFTVSPNTAVMKVFPSTQLLGLDCTDPFVYNHARYATVSVDQPSLSYVAAAPDVTAASGSPMNSKVLFVVAAHPFAVELQARDVRSGRQALGIANQISDEAGYFSLPDLTFDRSNPEVVVKILDGRSINGKWWLFYGGLTDLEYTLTVVDTAVDPFVVKTYVKPAGSLTGGLDLSLGP
jgi:hypothetical protein